MTVAASMKTIKSDDMFPEKDKLSDLHLQFYTTYICQNREKKRCKVKKLDFPFIRVFNKLTIFAQLISLHEIMKLS